MNSKMSVILVGGGIFALIFVVIAFNCFVVVPPGHEAVGVLFGNVQNTTYEEGFHVVNPMTDFSLYDTRQKTHKETCSVPSQDQLSTDMDVSIQYRVVKGSSQKILKETGDVESLIRVHLEPKLRSLIRQQGKSVKKAEDFFLEETQQELQRSMQNDLAEFLSPKGIEVTAVLVREIRLPAFIVRAIESKKEREQEAEKQIAELERFKTEQEQIVVQAEAQEKAAEAEARKRELLADAQAYEIKAINDAIAENPNYIKIRALDALVEMSKNPAKTLIFMDSGATQPLPLMNMSDMIKR